MAGTLSATIQAAVKEVVLEGVAKSYMEDDSMATYIGIDGGSDVEINDRGIRHAKVVRPNPSGGALSEAGALAVSGAQTFIAATMGFTEYSMGAAYSGRALAQMNSATAMEKGMAPYMARDKTTLLNEFSQDLFEDGKGIKAIAAGAAVGTTVTFHTTYAGGSTYGVRRALVGGRYNFINPATGAIRSGGGTSVCTVTGFNDAASTLTFDAVPTDIADGDYLVRENSYNKIIRGFGYAISSNALTVYGINRADYPEENSNIVDAQGEPLSFSLARRMDHQIALRRTMKGAQLDVFLGATQFQAIEEVFHPLVRIDNDTRVGKIGLDAFEFGGKRVINEFWCGDTDIWYICKPTWVRAFPQPIGVWEVDGNVLFPEPQYTGSTGTYKDNYLMWYIFRGDLYCKSPRDNGRTKNLGIASNLVRPYAVGR
jgi:hypothetical protein